MQPEVPFEDYAEYAWYPVSLNVIAHLALTDRVGLLVTGRAEAVSGVVVPGRQEYASIKRQRHRRAAAIWLDAQERRRHALQSTRRRRQLVGHHGPGEQTTCCFSSFLTSLFVLS